jgi:hypothetical protein
MPEWMRRGLSSIVRVTRGQRKAYAISRVGCAALADLEAESSNDALITGLYSCVMLDVPWWFARQELVG